MEKTGIILETERLWLRELEQADFSDLCKIHQDPITMKAYEHAFSDEEVQQWLNKNFARYQSDGAGLWAVVLKQTGQMIGECGLTWQLVQERLVLEVGYLFNRHFWHHGYATEAARACRNYGFAHFDVDEIYSIIRNTNEASRKVALRNGMKKQGEIVKVYQGIVMPHDLFLITRSQAQEE